MSTPSTKLCIAVIGCGSAGPAAALFFARAGHEVTVFERAESLGKVGAGFMIQPTGQHVLRRLGILGAVADKGVSLSGLRCETTSGRCLMDLDYADIGPGVHAIGLHRAVLLDSLTKALVADGVTLRLGSEVSEVESRTLTLQDGSREGPFDLIVAADGARSAIRSQLPIRFKQRDYAWGALWHMGPEERSTDQLFQVVDGTNKMVGLLPTGFSANGNNSLTSLFWSIHRDRVSECMSSGLSQWKAGVLTMIPQAESLLESISSLDQLTFARYSDVKMKSFYHENVVVIGDAAHATSPQLGQGVNLGLWDAMVLADCINSCDSVDEALWSYQRTRKRHLAYYQWATRFLTHFFQSDSKTLGVLRDFGMPLAGKIGPLRSQMVSTMAGIKRGFVRPSLRFPEVEKTNLLPVKTQS